MKNRIRELRKEQLLSANKLAKILNLSETSITSYERGDRDPSTKTLCEMAKIFDCSIDYLMHKTDFKNLKTYKAFNNELENNYKIISEAMKKGLTNKQLKAIINIWIECNKDS